MRVFKSIFVLSFAFINVICQSAEFNYQGQISLVKNGENFSQASGDFKFAIVDDSGERSYWSNDSSSINGNEPLSSVKVIFPDKNGVFSVTLGAAPMTKIPDSLFPVKDAYLRIWFSSDGQNFDLLEPDEKFTSVPYSIRAKVADSIADKSIDIGSLSSDFAGMTLVSDDPKDEKLLNFGFGKFGTINAKPWISASNINEPPPLIGHSSISYGEESSESYQMLIWGGSPLKNRLTNSGWIYNAASDIWSEVSLLDAPTPRINHTASIYRDNMIIWGGADVDGNVLSGGGIYNIKSDEWLDSTSLKTSFRLLVPRKNHTALVIGNKFLVWGGENDFDLVTGGGVYSFLTKEWKPINSEPGESPQKRKNHAALVISGKYLFIWGGESENGPLNDGWIYDPTTDKWAKLNYLNLVPIARSNHTATLIDDSIFIIGGKDINGEPINNGFKLDIDFNNNQIGQKDNIIADVVSLSENNALKPVYDHSASFTGDEILLFGGRLKNGFSRYGYAYDYKQDKWRYLNSKGGIIGRTDHTAAWSGQNLIIFGGLAYLNNQTGAFPSRISRTKLLDPQKTWHLYRKK